MVGVITKEATLINIIARLTTDDDFRRAFREDPRLAIERAGYNINDAELLTLTKLKDIGTSVSIKRTFKTLYDQGPAPLE